MTLQKEDKLSLKQINDPQKEDKLSLKYINDPPKRR